MRQNMNATNEHSEILVHFHSSCIRHFENVSSSTCNVADIPAADTLSSIVDEDDNATRRERCELWVVDNCLLVHSDSRHPGPGHPPAAPPAMLASWDGSKLFDSGSNDLIYDLETRQSLQFQSLQIKQGLFLESWTSTAAGGGLEFGLGTRPSPASSCAAAPGPCDVQGTVKSPSVSIA